MEIITNKMGRVRPVPEGEHDAGRDYRMLSIVYSKDTNKSYISKQDVPAGINIDNKTYWQVFGNGKFVDNAIINVSYLENSIIAHTLAEAISMVAKEDRRPGILLAFYEVITEVNESDRWNIYQFKGSSINDWNKQQYWHSVYQNGSAFKGWFFNSTDLVKQYPVPSIGNYAYVGNTLEESVIWRCNIDGTWTNTTEKTKNGIQVILGGNVTISSNNTWIVNGIDTGLQAKGDIGNTPLLRKNNDLKAIQVSYDNGENYQTLISYDLLRTTIQVQVETLPAGSQATAENIGTSLDAIIKFGIPKGDPGPQGPQGNTGANVDYPYELINNIETDDATKGLSAAQGVILNNKIIELGQEVFAFVNSGNVDYNRIVRELYVSQRGGTPYSVYSIWRNINGVWGIRITTNVEGSTYIGTITSDYESPYIEGYLNDNITKVQAIIDWSLIPNGTHIDGQYTAIIQDIAYDKDYSPAITAFENNRDIRNIYDILTEKMVSPLTYSDELIHCYIHRSGTIRDAGSGSFGLYLYEVNQGDNIHIECPILQNVDYKSVAFKPGEKPIVGDVLITIFGTTNETISTNFIVPTNGWMICYHRSETATLTKIVETDNIGIKTINGQSVVGVGNLSINVDPDIIHPLHDKTIAIFGDSIMQLMAEETTPSLSGIVTLKNKSNPVDTTIYQIEESTVISGIIYLTSSLTDGQPTTNSIQLEIVNSNQSVLDSMTWTKLQQKMLAKDVICLGFGGASIRQKEIGITTEYPVIGLLNEGSPAAFDNTVNLPNEVKMLKRLVDSGIRNIPDCCIIWMGVNSSHIREGKTLDWAMQLDYTTLADDILGFADRCEFFGGLRYAVETLYREFPYTNIILVSPYQTAFADHTSDDIPNNYRGYSFLDNVSNAIRDLAKRYSCIFIDAFHEIGIANFAWKANSADGKHAEAPTLGNLIPLYTRDGLHPSSEGKVLLLNYLTKRVETLYFAKQNN